MTGSSTLKSTNRREEEPRVAAQEAHFAGSSWPGRHHALVDAYALRERWREYQRLVTTGCAV